MIHYSVSDSIAEIRIDHLPVNGLGVSKINDLIAALSRAAAAANGSRRGQHRRPRSRRTAPSPRICSITASRGAASRHKKDQSAARYRTNYAAALPSSFAIQAWESIAWAP